MFKFNNTVLTAESIQQTRVHFAAVALSCIRGAQRGEFFVNDLRGYVAWKQDDMRKIAAGDYDHTFTHLQYAHFVQTGECMALLPH